MYTILVVDDNDFERESLINIIKEVSSDIEILDADSGFDALDILQNKIIDTIITDIKMPLMNGIELIHRVRSRNKEVKIVIISGFDDFSYAKKALPLHVEDYILKPINPLEIKDILSKLISSEHGTPQQNNFVEKALQIINQEYAENLTLESISDRIYISSPYLGTLFTKNLGMSFNQYLTHIRMEKAAELLNKTSFKILTIGRLVGITNSSYFNKVFKQTFGLTPLEYRQKKELKNE